MCVRESPALSCDEIFDRFAIKYRVIGAAQDSFHVIAPCPFEPTGEWDRESLLSHGVELRRKGALYKTGQQELAPGFGCPQDVGAATIRQFVQAIGDEGRADVTRCQHACAV